MRSRFITDRRITDLSVFANFEIHEESFEWRAGNGGRDGDDAVDGRTLVEGDSGALEGCAVGMETC